jgi:hypothetical protein
MGHPFLISAAGTCMYDVGGRFCGLRREAAVHEPPPMGVERFVSYLAALIDGGEHVAAVDRLTGNTLAINVDAQTFVLEVNRIAVPPAPPPTA